jgi:hypothetical protein
MRRFRRVVSDSLSSVALLSVAAPWEVVLAAGTATGVKHRVATFDADLCTFASILRLCDRISAAVFNVVVVRVSAETGAGTRGGKLNSRAASVASRARERMYRTERELGFCGFPALPPVFPLYTYSHLSNLREREAANGMRGVSRRGRGMQMQTHLWYRVYIPSNPAARTPLLGVEII